MTLAESVKLRDYAQADLEKAVAAEFPKDTAVEFQGFRGAVKGHVIGTEGETVLVKSGEAVTRRNFSKVTKV